jgi:phosphatidylinositol alpha-mannosyltransferase
MKIAIFTPYNIFISGGVQEHVQNQARILTERGHDVTILTPRPRTRLEHEAPSNVVFLGSSARIKAPHATSADVSITVDNDAVDAELAKGYDVVHVHEPTVPVAPRQVLARAEGKALRVGTFHAALPGNALGKSLIATYKTYTRSVIPHIDVITAVSPAAIGYFETFTDLTINYIPNGINFNNVEKKQLKRDKNTILFLGRLEKRKGARYTIKAFAELKKNNKKVKLIIAGDGPLRKSLEQFVKDKGIEDVSFMGFVDDKTKNKLLSTCGIYTSPALYGESFGIVLAEAMAAGAPIVAHPNAGYKWVLQNTGRLSLVDCTDIDAYSQRMQLLLEDDDLRKLWQKWACNYVKQFDYEKVVDSYEKLYKKNLRK